MRSRVRAEEGANAVEFALVLPLLITLIFGAIWGGFALNSQVALSQSAREAARFGATLDAIGSSGWFDEVEQRLLDTLSAQLVTGEAITGCIRAYGEGGVAIGTRTVGAGGSCSGGAIADESATQAMPRVEIVVNTTTYSIGSLFPSSALGSEAIARYELAVP